MDKLMDKLTIGGIGAASLVAITGVILLLKQNNNEAK
jgi:hypothetical protein